MTINLIAHITKEDGSLKVEVTVAGSDLEFRHGWILRPTASALALRLKSAVDAGAVFKNVRVMTDVYGKEYVTGDSQVFGRFLNADLKRLGF